MILVICHEADGSAAWAAAALRRRGLPLTLLTGRDLAAVRRWRHTLSPDGAAAWAFELEPGRTLRSADVRGVLNRLSAVPWTWLSRIGGPDRLYAAQEMHAFYLSWLQALPGAVLNRPTPQGLCGNIRHPAAWTALALRAGLPVRPYRQTCDDDVVDRWRPTIEPTRQTVLVIGDRVIGPGELTRAHAAALRRLAHASGCALLGVDFARAPDGGWRMTGANPAPDLTVGGERLADALADALGVFA